MVSTRSSPSTDRVFSAFADRTRLRLLNLLRDGEKCVCVLVDVLRQPQPTVSRHLGHLRRAGLVQARKDGMWVHYKLAEPATELHRRLLACIECCLADVPELVKDRKRSEVSLVGSVAEPRRRVMRSRGVDGSAADRSARAAGRARSARPPIALSGKSRVFAGGLTDPTKATSQR